MSLTDVRRLWPDLLEQVKKMRRFTWILLSQNAQVIGVDASSITVGFKTAGARDSFVGGGSEEILRQAAIDLVGVDWKVETAVDSSAQPGAETSPRVIRPAVLPDEMPAATAPSQTAPEPDPLRHSGARLSGATCSRGAAQLGHRRRGPGAAPGGPARERREHRRRTLQHRSHPRGG